MDRNSNTLFSLNPVNIDIERSRFHMPHEVKTSFNVGDLIPFDVQEVLPGDTFEVDTSIVARMQPMVSAPMDNLYLDTYYFFVPNRLVWSHWKEFMGENTESAWIPTTEYTIPEIQCTNGAEPGSILDYMGVPTNITNAELLINALPVRAYALCCQDWFRNENLSSPLDMYYGDELKQHPEKTDPDYSDPVIGVPLGGAPWKVAKFRDYFTSCLPGPQKGPDVAVANQNRVYFGPINQGDADYFKPLEEYGPIESRLGFHDTSGNHSQVMGFYNYNQQFMNNLPDTANRFQPLNWFTDTQISVNSMRLAFQIQKLYEKEARSGSRYTEILKGHFNVTAPDASLQRPQYLGGAVRIPIQINEILQTSESGTTPQGNVAGYSLTSDLDNSFTASFTEHGYVIGVMCARYDHTYQQGLNRLWSRRNKLDFYFPVLANIGEQPVLRKEIYATGTQANDEKVFGYQEAWADYRYRPNIVTGEMRSNINNSLDSWHFADDYSSAPTLSDGWIREDKSNIDRVLAVTSANSNQIFCDILIDCYATRPMPLYSIPGLIDHH